MLSKAKIKYIQTLGQKKQREQERVFIAEGPKLVAELLTQCPGQAVEIFATEDWINAGYLLPAMLPVHRIDDFELAKISQLTNPHQVVALVKMFEPANSPDPAAAIVLALDAIRDPGNLGTIIRIADWFGIRHIVCSEDSADVYNPKVVQATMGSLFRVPVHYCSIADWLEQHPAARIYAAMLDGKSVRTFQPISAGVVVIGNEGQGISAALQEKANVKVTIERRGEAESLNAAVATGIILSHLVK